MANQEKNAANITVGRCRGSYVSIFRPRMNTLANPPKEEFSMTLLIPKSDTASVTKIREAIKVAIVKKWGDKPPNGLKMPLRDGDAERPDDAAYKGHFFLNVKSAEAPGIVDASRAPCADPKAFVSGDYCFANLTGFGYETRQNNIVISKGVSFGLNHVMIAGKGDPLTGRVSAEDAFADVDVAGMDNSDI